MTTKSLHPSVATLLNDEAATVGELIARLQQLPTNAPVASTYEGLVSPLNLAAITLETVEGVAGNKAVLIDAER